MGASRKLQGEIDRVLKKVQEGVDVFDSIWNKVYDTDNANQKEKFEADLKKEIKKLQRYRDQIKTWIQSSEIKDKKVSASYEQCLLDARKQIEREMERFKICEKETKTKAFSKEGLGQQPKTDPKEKAKSETRDWINNVVGELDTQIDIFEAEIEGLSVKKGKNRPPRLTHLETSIARHKAHIMKLELILRLLDNDELSPEQVNDVKDFLDDYVDRNQEDFDEFSDVDELYISLPLDKVESLEELVTIGAPGLLKGTPVHSLKSSSVMAATQITAPTISGHQQVTSVPEPAEESSPRNANADVAAETPSKAVAITSVASTPAVASISSNLLGESPSGVPTSSSILPGPTSTRVVPESPAVASSPSTVVSSLGKEEDNVSLPGRRPSTSISVAAMVRGLGRSAVSNQTSATLPPVNTMTSSGTIGAVPSASDIIKRNAVGLDDKIGSGSNAQPLVSPLSSRIVLPQSVKSTDGAGITDSGSNSDNAIAGRVFSPPVVSGLQWRSGSSFNQNEAGQFRGRTEIAPDQREKFLQRLQQVQQQGHSNLLGMPPLGGAKQFSVAQQNPLLQQFNSQSSSVSPQAGISLGLQTGNTLASAAVQQPSSIPQQFSHQGLTNTGPKDAEPGHGKIEEHQTEQIAPEDSSGDSVLRSSISKNTMNEDDLKSPHSLDVRLNPTDQQVGVSGSLSEPISVTKEIDLSPGQPILNTQSSGSLGVIGRRSVPDLGAVGDSFSVSPVTPGPVHDQLYNMQMLEAGFHRLPQPKDSERARTFTPRHPVVTPSSYPQNTYQQYLAAKELKKQSWRYHKKYHTWFQRHEEPKVATDEYEQGTYVYFDFNMTNDELQNGWCQRIKTEFKFEYSYLEDELMV
ncbi:hypothetical protein MLD38_025924 [Melastoma candidum]|uniref:Uncharacterized protein n=1 Tax=Melastoma candidum TaxID=119954 RepID=A0ACB9NYI0_9MYRT|nr:hypothetical protein MLD38_025924 [Melastoma candidum]